MQRPPWNGSVFDPTLVNSRRSLGQKCYFSPMFRLPVEREPCSRGSSVGSVTSDAGSRRRSRRGEILSSVKCAKCHRCGARVQVPEGGSPQQSCEQGEPEGTARAEWNVIRKEYEKIISTLETGLTSSASMRFLRRQLDELRSRVQQLDFGEDEPKQPDDCNPEILQTPPRKEHDELVDSPAEKTYEGKGKGKGKAPAPPPLPKDGRKSVARQLPKTRRLQWQTLPQDRIAGTVFEHMPWGSAMNAERVLDLFTVRNTIKVVKKRQHKTELLTQARAQSMLIVLRACPLTSKLLSILEGMDFDTAIDPDVCEMLYTAVPTPEESKLLLGYTGNVSDLRDAELQVLPLARFCNPTVDKRLQFLLFNQALPGLQSEISTGFSMLQTALRNIKDSIALRAVLRHTLQLGNFLNLGLTQSCTEAVPGFNIEILDRLILLKATSDSRISLLHVLVSQLVVEDATMLTALQELSGDICQALERPAQSLAESIAAIRQELEQCCKCAEEVRAAAADAGDPVASNLAALAERASLQTSLLDEQLTSTRSTAMETLRFLGDAVQDELSIDVKMEEFLRLLAHFLSVLDQVYIKEVQDQSSMLIVCCGHAKMSL